MHPRACASTCTPSTNSSHGMCSLRMTYLVRCLGCPARLRCTMRKGGVACAASRCDSRRA
eukprot:5162367-Pleurochrysis_carterae.AAC.1